MDLESQFLKALNQSYHFNSKGDIQIQKDRMAPLARFKTEYMHWVYKS